MTTPSGETAVVERADRARHRPPRARARPTSRSGSSSTGPGIADVTTGVGFYDHLLGSLAHHGLFDLTIRASGDLGVDEHHTVEDVALVLGSAFAEALGDRAGIARFGESSVPMDEARRHRDHRHRRPPVRGHRPAVPRRTRRRPAAPAGRARARGVCPDRRRDAPRPRHRPERPPPRGGRIQGARPRPPRRPTTLDPRRIGVRLHEGHPRMSGGSAAPDAAARRGRRLRRRQPGEHRAGARAQSAPTVTHRPRPGGPATARRLVVPGVGAAAPGDGPAARRRASWTPIRAWIAADRPFLGICLGLQLLFEGSDEDGAETLGVLPGRTVRLDGAPTLPHIGWNQVVRRREHPAVRGDRRRRRLLLRPLLRRRARRRRPRTSSSPRRPTADVRERGRPRPPARRPVPPGAERRRRPSAPRQRRSRPRRCRAGREPGLMLGRRVIPCLDVADGRVVKGTRFVDLVDEGDPPELAARYAARGRRRDRVPGHHRRAGRARHAPRRSSSAPPAGCSSRSPSAAACGRVEDMRAVLRAGADKVALNTAAVARPRRSSRRAPPRSGRQAVVVAIDARRADRPTGDGWEVVVRGGREPTAATPSSGRERAVELGAGELLVTSIDRDGTGRRLRHRAAPGDHDRVQRAGRRLGRRRPGRRTSWPRSRDGGADAVLAASIFHRRHPLDRGGQGGDGRGRPAGPDRPRRSAA